MTFSVPSETSQLTPPVGLLINFSVPVLKQGIRRLLNPAAAVDQLTA